MFDNFSLVGRKISEEGLVSGFSGSLSVRDGEKIFITKRNVILSEIKKDDILEFDLSSSGDDSSAYDFLIHKSIYENSQAKAIVHAHPSHAVAISMQEEKIIPQDMDGKMMLKTVPVVRVREPITNDEIIKFLVPGFKNGGTASVVRGHGSYTIGETLEDAYMLSSILEGSCRIMLLSKLYSLNNYTPKREDKKPQYRSAIPPSIGVMDRSYRKR